MTSRKHHVPRTGSDWPSLGHVAAPGSMHESSRATGHKGSDLGGSGLSRHPDFITLLLTRTQPGTTGRSLRQVE